MKLTIILLTAAIVQLSAKGLSQKVSFNGKNASLQEVLSAVKKQTGFSVAYNEVLLDRAKPVSLNVTDLPLKDFLQQVFQDQPLDFSINNTTIAVFRKADTSNRAIHVVGEEAILPPTPIRGRVLDAEGTPLTGVTVTLKGGKVLGFTNAEGVFFVNVSVGDVLLISSVGFESIDYKISSAIVASSGQPSTSGTDVSLTITLKRTENQLDEVVISKGYYSETKRLSTGNVSKVTSKDIEKQPVSNPLQALIGRVPGVYIQQSTGVPGGGFEVQIRGRNSIRSSIGVSNPFYIIDGVPFTSTALGSSVLGGSLNILGNANPLNSINPADIENIQILKDADATAIYGSRGANGVVLITTKKGKAGKTRLNINMYTGVQKVTRMLDMLNTKQYVEMRKEAFYNDGQTLETWNAPDLLLWDTNRYTNWQKELIGGTAHVTDAQVGVSGGNENTQFMIGGGYHRETTVFPGDFVFKKMSGHFNLNHRSENKKFNLIFSSNYSVDDNDLFSADPTNMALILPPNAPAFLDENGKLLFTEGYYYNPYADLLKKYNTTTNNFISNMMLSYELFKGFQVKTSLGYTRMQRDEIQTNPISAVHPEFLSFAESSANFRNGSIKTWIIEPQAEYKTIIGKGKLSAIVGATFQENKQAGTTLTATGYTSDALLENIQAATDVAVDNATYTQYRYNALFFRVNYDWKTKYLINLTGRRDGSSRFGPNRQFANFGAVGAAWIFSNENFIQKELPFISFGKLRASYGITGSDLIGDYQYLDTYSSTTYAYQGNGGLVPSRLFNPDFAWEKNKKFELALELGFVKDRIMLSASYYRNRSDNQLVGYPLPPSTGFATIQYNLPALVQNTGVELELNTVNINKKNITWTTSINATIPRNKLVSYPNIKGSPYSDVYEVGKSLYIIKAYHYLGVDPQSGIYQFEDADKDGAISYPNDLQATKIVGQEFYGGIQNALRYKKWQFDVFFQFVKQTGYNYLASTDAPGVMFNQPAVVMGRWQKPGDIATTQRFTQDYGPAYFGHSDSRNFGDNRISDASFIRLKNVSLSYQFLSKWTHGEASKIYIQAQNLLTISNFLGLDPENQSMSSLPPLSTIAIGIQLNF